MELDFHWKQRERKERKSAMGKGAGKQGRFEVV
jgi:hypothetical protein